MERSPGIRGSRDLGGRVVFLQSFCGSGAGGMAAAGKALTSPYPHSGPVSESSLGKVSFLGARLPPEVEAMAKSVRDLGKETFRRLLKVAVSALEGKDCKESVKMIAESTSLSDEQLAVLISGMYMLLREALRLPTSSFKQEVFKDDLKELRRGLRIFLQLESDDGLYLSVETMMNFKKKKKPYNKTSGLPFSLLRIPEDFIADFVTVAFGNRRPVLEAALQEQTSKLPRINDFRWRVDVAISTSSLARALQPSILMQLRLSDGTAHRFEVPVAKFHELRYNVALILKEMNDLEKRSVLRIQD
ncbi:hypothetical protein lerEdw1_010490 [Lerista edwardsae]|nr:hypothetical protein lerEdw1_010490 [Lerista edwardsae]